MHCKGPKSLELLLNLSSTCEANVSLGLAEPGPTVLSRSVYDTLDTVFFVVYVMDMLTRMCPGRYADFP